MREEAGLTADGARRAERAATGWRRSRWSARGGCSPTAAFCQLETAHHIQSEGGDAVRLRQAKAQLEAEAAAREQAYQRRVAAHTAAAEAKGRKPRTLKRRPQETPNPEATANVTDPCSRFLHTRNGTVQGYNAQASRPWSR